MTWKFDGIDAREVALLEQLRHLRDESLLHGLPLLRAEGAGMQQIGVGAERLVDLLEVEELHRVGMPAPVVEIAHEAARVDAFAVRPEARLRQPVEQRMARDGQKFLACVSRGRLGVRIDHCRGSGRRRSIAGAPFIVLDISATAMAAPLPVVLARPCSRKLQRRRQFGAPCAGKKS